MRKKKKIRGTRKAKSPSAKKGSNRPLRGTKAAATRNTGRIATGTLAISADLKEKLSAKAKGTEFKSWKTFAQQMLQQAVGA
jgi:hypothetical protein